LWIFPGNNLFIMKFVSSSFCVHLSPFVPVLLFFLSVLSSVASPEALEIGKSQTGLLPGGKEADGIVGDFLMRNNLIEAVISSDAPLRKADMGGWWDAVSPGCLYDLTLRGTDNDQLTVFSPSNQRGPVTYVRVVDSGESGEAVIEVLVSAASNDGLEIVHRYRLRDDWHGLLISTHVHNQSDQTVAFDPIDQWKPVNDKKKVAGITVWDSVDPADKCGYATTWMDLDGCIMPGDEPLSIEPGQRVEWARAVAVGASPAQAFGFLAALKSDAGTLTGVVSDSTGSGIGKASLTLKRGESALTAYPDKDGRFTLQLPAGEYEVEVQDRGRSPLTRNVVIVANDSTPLMASMNAPAKIDFDIRDAHGRSIPCKVQFKGLDDTKTPNLGPANRAHGCVDQYHSEKGAFSVQVTPGKYQITVTHGIEYSHLRRIIELRPETTLEFGGQLTRLVDTTGWVSTDFHNHSTPSGDNHTKTDDRIINLAVEQVEFVPTTEHNRLYDWTPHIEKLGLAQEMLSVPGLELTGSGAHFNAFPFTPTPFTQDHGAPQWQKDPRLNAIVLRDFQGAMAERWVHLNHPDTVADFVDRNGDGRPDLGYLGLENMMDAAEVWGLNILADAPYYIAEAVNKQPIVRNHREFVWRQLLNTGRKMWSIAVSDAHSVHGNGVGGWRTYVPSSTDNPSEIDWQEIVRNAKAGRMMMTTGPFLEVETEDGQISGGFTRAQGSIRVKVKVQCTDWIKIDRVQVLVNSRKVPSLNYTAASHPDMFQKGLSAFEQTIEVPLSEDSHLMVVAYGENEDLSIGYGTSSQASWKPCAYHNPIYVDVDGNGFQPNGDTLGWELPVKRLDVDEVKSMIERRKP
jgi:hypothetical protein